MLTSYRLQFRQTKDGGYVLAGLLNGGYFLLLKLDTMGNFQWQKTYRWESYSGVIGNVSTIQQTTDGGYALAGWTKTASGAIPSAWVMKTDQNGNVVWHKKYGSSIGHEADSIVETDDGGYVVLGTRSDGLTFWVVKLDMSGAIEWEKKLTGSWGYVGLIQKTSDGGYVVCGSYGVDAIVIKLNNIGEVLWEKTYHLSSANVAIFIQQTTDNGYVLTGGGSSNIMDFWVMKLDPSGNISGCMEKNIRTLSPTVVNTDTTVTTSIVSTWEWDGRNCQYYLNCVTATPINVTVVAGTLADRTVCVETESNISVQPDLLNFGSIELRSSASQSVTVANTGKANLIISSISITGSNPADFSQTNNCTVVSPNASCSITVAFSPGSMGMRNASLNIASNDPGTPIEIVALSGTGVDTTPPVTTSMITGKKGNNDWYVSDVALGLTATDYGSGVKDIYSAVDKRETIVAGGSASFTLVGDGTHAVTYYAKDNAGNTETAHPLSLKIDKTPPLITALVSPATNAGGWHNGDVTVTFTCSDALSGIASCPAPVTVSTEGAGQVVSGTAVDKAGNAATTSVTLNIDKAAPSLSVSITSARLWPPNHKMATVTPSVLVTDANPGATVKLVSVTSSEPDNGLGDGDTANDIVINNTGTISLRAERSGAGNGQVYTITYQATDIAGNTSTASATVSVPHDMR
jgi:hypothetical protein